MEPYHHINWQKLSEISELEEFFREDFDTFRQLIEDSMRELDQFSEASLTKVAKLSSPRSNEWHNPMDFSTRSGTSAIRRANQRMYAVCSWLYEAS